MFQLAKADGKPIDQKELAFTILAGLPTKYEAWLLTHKDDNDVSKLLKELEETDKFMQGKSLLKEGSTTSFNEEHVHIKEKVLVARQNLRCFKNQSINAGIN
jgi:hypothetical protein